MKPKVPLIIAAAAVVLLVLRFFLAGPEERIRRMLHRVADAASKEAGERPIVAAARARSISEDFTLDAYAEELQSGDSVTGRDRIARTVAGARQTWIEGDVLVEDLTVELTGVESASAELRIRILDREGRPAAEWDGSRAELELRKEAGSWKISRATLLPPEAFGEPSGSQ